ncbi:RCC1 domain-containing protein [Pandoraea oxalativorans]|uniref:Uncharacterized protein n=1 Tax=Pandoraea oxalativorans TaxID=573737 RepID=A0A0E3YDL0_9BURK|nr:hypothetical protein [Pandoraea oxalativorans]AKC71610.1 hypothetical protein MB84_22360 [Pandoraea oxalativorans]
MNIRDKFPPRDASHLDETRQLLAPEVPLADANGGIRKKDVYTDLADTIQVNVRWYNFVVRGDTLRLYWGRDDTAVDVITVENTNDSIFQLNAPVVDVLAQGDGLIEVWYERISAGGDPVPQKSPVIQVLVKTTVPGGDDPDQSTFPLNENLAKVILPPGPIEDPVPPEGILVTIPAWQNMAAGDKVRLFWAHRGTDFDPIDAAQVGQPLELMVPKFVIDGVGGDNVAVTYEIRDAVSNWSGRAGPAFIEVDVGGTLYDAPLVPRLDNDELDYDALAGADVQAIAVRNGDMAAGDDVTIVFEGRSFEGWLVTYTETKPLGTGGMVEFYLPNAKIGEAVPGEGSVLYRVENAGVSKGRSRRQSFTIRGEAAPLPAPEVREAVGSTLDPGAVVNGANVDIEPWTGMAVGDLVTLRWEGTTAGGDPVPYTEPKQLAAPDIGNTLNFLVPFSQVSAIAGGRVVVHYTVETDVSTRSSERLSLTVLENAALQPPLVEGETGGDLDPSLVPDGPDLTIPQWPRMAVGDSVTWFWLGTSDGGQESKTVVVQSVGDVVARVDPNVLAINANGNDKVTVLYAVTYVGGGTSQSVIKTLNVLPLPENLLPAPVVEEAVDDTLNPDDIDDFATVTVAPYTGMADGDVVWVYFGEGSGGGEMSQHFLVSENHVGVEIQMFVPKAKVEFFDTSSVTVYYRVVKGAGVEQRSHPLVLNVSSPLRWPAPRVPQATGDYLPEDAYPVLVHTTVLKHPDMLSGDIITIYWGEGAREYSDRVPVTTPMDFPFRVEKAIVNRWFGETVAIRYTITRGPLVIHSEVLNLRVGVKPTELALPEMDQVVDGKLNVSDLTYGADVRVPIYDDMRWGDVVTIEWEGGIDHGGLTLVIQVSENQIGKPIESFFAIGDVRRFEGQTVTVDYRIEGDLGTRQSDSIEFDVVSEATTLEPPRIPAVVNGELDPRQVINGAQVIVPYSAGNMQQGDIISMLWDCTNDGGDHTASAPVGGGTVDITFTVPYAKVEAGIDGTVTVSYEVRRGGNVIGSGTATAFVIKMTELPAVVIVEANGDNLDPDDVPVTGATAEIAETAVFVLGDIVTLFWEGATDYQVPHTIAAVDVGKALRLMIPKAYVDASNGSVASVYYTIVRKVGGHTETSPTATYDVGRELGRGDLLVLGARNGSAAYRASSSPRYLRAVSATTRQDIVVEWRYKDDVTAFTGSSFLDTQPWRSLSVRTEDASTSIRPVHLAGTGTDSASTTGAAAFGALLKQTGPYAWGHLSWGANIPSDYIGMDGFVEISTTPSSMAARLYNGTVVAWGQANTGGVVSPMPINVKRVVGNAAAFAGMRNDGTLLAWGNPANGGQLSQAALLVRDAESLASTGGAFCVRRATGTLVAWGAATHGGAMPPAHDTTPFASVMGNFMAFCALTPDGRLAAWQDAAYGGVLSAEAAAARNVASLASATARAFAVLTTERKVIAWGPESHGGVVSDAARLVTDFVEITATWGAFCGRRENGRLILWGDTTRGNSLPPAYANEDFVQVVGTARAFAGLLRDGRVLTWGDPNFGGNSSAVAPRLVNIRAVYSNSEAFAAIRHDGGVVTWGIANGGGTLTPAQEALLNEHMRYEAEGSAVDAASPQGRALALFQQKRMTSTNIAAE